MSGGHLGHAFRLGFQGGADEHRLQIRTREAHQRLLVRHGGDIGHRGLDPELLQHHAVDLVVLARRLGIEERDVLFGAALALEVDGEQIGPAGDEEPQDFPAVSGVAHESGDLREDAILRARIAARVAIAERGIRLVDDHAHRRQ